MCGIAGFVAFHPIDRGKATASLQAMCDSISHRGPDGDGLFIEPELGVALGHRRLSIVDLTDTGSQPMNSPSGRFCIVFNGEIYGFLKLREELAAKGVHFKGTSDTEVMLAAMDAWGVRDALQRIHGMFAFAVLDRKERRLFFARDRMGKKPLYLSFSNGRLLFGSEMKALRAHEAFGAPEISRPAVAEYFRYGYVPAPLSIYRNAVKLPAGSLLELDLGAAPESASALAGLFETYWDFRNIALGGLSEPFAGEQEALDEIERRLCQAVEERMVADVPVGTFLSGGIDSTLVTAIMQELSSDKVTSFTVRFDDETTNEADFAAAIARHIGTDHHEVTATPEMALDLLGEFSRVYDEPFADPSAFPTLLVSQLARSRLKVVMSGDGGDESFGGYGRYARMMAIERLKKKVPGSAASTLAAAPHFVTRAVTPVLRAFAPGSLQDQITPDRIGKLASVLAQPDFQGRYDTLFTMWQPEAALIEKSDMTAAFRAHALPDRLDKRDAMMMLDTEIYLPDDILVKVDRASMSVGLEVRAPLLDYRVVEAAWRSPSSLRFDGKNGKIALHRLLEKRLPKSLFDRPKQGFGIPVNQWLRGPLKGHATEVFESGRAIGDVLDRKLLLRYWHEHLSGERNWGAQLWAALMFHSWQETWLS